MAANQSATAWSAEAIRRYLLKHPAVAVSLLYLLTTLIGVSYAWLHFAQFGLTIFDFWQPSDLVLAGFREPASFVFAAVFSAYAWWAWRDTQTQRSRMEARIRAYELEERAGTLGWYPGVRLRQMRAHLKALDAPRPHWIRWLGGGSEVHRSPLLFVAIGAMMFLVFAHAHIQLRAKFPQRWFPTAGITLVQTGQPFADAERDPQLLIGASNGFLFLASQYGGEVTVLPLSSVATLRLREPEGRWWQRFAP